MASKEIAVFVVDDDTAQLLLLKDHLEKNSEFPLKLTLFTSGENCMQRINEQPEIVILDYNLDGIRPDAKNGLEILKEIDAYDPDIDVVMMSGQDDIQVALHTLEFGAYDYVVKGESALIRMQLVVDHLLEKRSSIRWSKQHDARMRILYVLTAVLLILLIISSYYAMRR